MLMNEKFLEIYQQIELAIRENYPEVVYPGQNIVASIATLDQFKSREDMIFALRNIRNTLSHAKQINGQDIITVNDSFIQFAEALLLELKQPQIIEIDKKYKTVTLNDTVDTLVKVMKSKRDVPVLDTNKKVIGVLSPDEFFDISCSKKYAPTAKLSEFKKHVKIDGRAFAKPMITQKELANIIEEYRMIGVKIYGIILTEDGTKSGKFISYIKVF